MAEFTDGQVLAALSAALRDKDMDDVVALLHVLALQAPAKARVIYDAIMGRAGAVRPAVPTGIRAAVEGWSA